MVLTFVLKVKSKQSALTPKRAMAGGLYRSGVALP
jgi:hypothetical protein